MVALLLMLPSLAAAQRAEPLSPERPWRTLEARHFVVHYPAEFAEWTLPVAARLDSVHAAVAAMVGNAPARKVTVVVADPFNATNAFALPFLRAPTMVFWPTPPDPRRGIGEHRDWGELIAVHEYAHLAHLVWASRNPRERRLSRLLPPQQTGPIHRRAPRWVIEGYATYIEGRLTGAGRPHGVWRPTTLRQWALEGRLPTYPQLSSWNAFEGGAMAYMVGSAFLEWLVAHRGEESLNHLWRRLTAVQHRGFADAFAGVFGAPPDELYGLFTVEVMREAMEAERLLREAGLIEGEQFQRLGWYTGDPAVSADGSRMAIVLRERDQPSRVVVWSTDPPEPLVREEERQRLLQRDPLDVPAIEWRPRSKQALATLRPVAGRGHDTPRFLPDGRHLLVVRSEPLPDGRLRTDLFQWDSDGGGVRRITHGAGVRQPDPSPQGDHAVAVRCEGGICDLVRVDLRTGSLRVLRGGAPDVVFYRPRYAADGERIAVAVQAAGRWRLALTDTAGAPLRYIDPDDGHDRYDAAWLSDDALVVVSHRGGVANLERIELPSGTVRPLTRTTSAALAPEPNPADGSIFFLRLRTRGLDLNRLPPDAPEVAQVVDLQARLPRVAPTGPTQPVDTFPIEPLPAPRPYGIGPQKVLWLPAAGAGAEGFQGGLTLAGTDPIGRLSWTLSGAYGQPGTWRGGGLEAAWRGIRPVLRGNLWWASQRPGQQARAPMAAAPLDADYAGATLWTEAQRIGTRDRQSARVGASYGWLDRPFADRQTRRLALVDLEAAARFGTRRFLQPSLRLHGSAGQTAGSGWQRAIVTARLSGGRDAFGLAADATYGTLGGDIDGFEAFAVGGSAPLVFNSLVLPQRMAMPAVPLGTLSGRQLLALRGTVSLGALQPFFWAASTDDGFQSWYRVLGVQQSFFIGPAPLYRLPEVQVTGGLGYSLDEPNRHRLQSYLLVQYRP